MPPRMTTQSAGRATATPRGGRTGGPTGRRGGRTRGRSGDLRNGGIDGQGGQVGGQGTEVNDGVDGVPDFSPDFSTIITQQLQNLLPTILAQVGDQGSNLGMVGIKMVMSLMTTSGAMLGMSLRTTTVLVIKKMESVQDMSGCRDNQKVKYTARSFS
ncbi:hypothetical protein Tco_1223294, partial [Tanacetum coccineum]